jgi:hypothetical protein
LLESSGKISHLKVLNGHEFSIAHCTGKVLYDAQDMIGKNRDFLLPEMVDTLCLSSNKVVKLLFTNQLSNTGNLIMSAEDCGVITNMKNRWGTALMAGNACRTRVRRLLIDCLILGLFNNAVSTAEIKLQIICKEQLHLA